LVEANKKSFRKMFPHLAKELTSGESKISIDSVRTNPEQAEKTPPDRLHNYNPTVIDFLRRCTTEKEAHEIIAYLEKRSEITKEHAQQLKKQLKKKGIRSFGPKKEDGHYFRQSGLC
jgi:hypothetical protein